METQISLTLLLVQGDILVPYLFIICLDYVFQTSIDLMKENIFTLKKARSWWYPTQTILDTDYAALLANTPTQAEYLLQQAPDGISPHVNADKTEYMCFNQKGDMSTLNGGTLKLVDKFIYLKSSISSTENDINMQLAKAWTAINRLSIIWKSDLSNEIKCNFSKQWLCQFYYMDAPHGYWLSV